MIKVLEYTGNVTLMGVILCKVDSDSIAHSISWEKNDKTLLSILEKVTNISPCPVLLSIVDDETVAWMSCSRIR